MEARKPVRACQQKQLELFNLLRLDQGKTSRPQDLKAVVDVFLELEPELCIFVSLNDLFIKDDYLL